MLVNLNPAIDRVLHSEGGFVDHPNDPGGPTNLGVTLRTLTAWYQRPITIAELKALTFGTASQIFIAQYATPVNFENLPSGLDYAVFDASINSGPGRAVKILQQVLGFEGERVDGSMGAITLAAVAEHEPAELIAAYCDARLAFMQSLATWKTFGVGWAGRVAEVKADALKLARGTALVLPPRVSPLSVNAPSYDEIVRNVVGAAATVQAKATGAVSVTATKSGQSALTALAGAVVMAGGAATQASGLLSAFSSFRYIEYALVALGVVAAAAPFAVAWQRSQGGATT